MVVVPDNREIITRLSTRSYFRLSSEPGFPVPVAPALPFCAAGCGVVLELFGAGPRLCQSCECSPCAETLLSVLVNPDLLGVLNASQL